MAYRLQHTDVTISFKLTQETGMVTQRFNSECLYLYPEHARASGCIEAEAKQRAKKWSEPGANPETILFQPEESHGSS